MTEYERALMGLDEAKINNLFAAYQQAKAPAFSGGRKFDSSTMGIATPQDVQFAERAKEVAPNLLESAANTVAAFAPGSGEYISARQSTEDVAKAREAINNGDYASAAAHGLESVVNAVGSIPIAHQIMALGKGAVGVAKGLMGAEHIIPAITTYHGSPTSGIRKWDLNFRGTGEGRLPVDSPARESFKDMIGHGLYSAEKEGIAKGYQERLAGTAIYYKGEHVNPKDKIKLFEDPDMQGAIYSLEANGGDIDKTIREFTSAIRNQTAPAQVLQNMQGEVNWLKQNRKYIDTNKPSGSLYTTELTPHPDEFLIWDKPLSEQSEKVKAAMIKAQQEKLGMKHDAIPQNTTIRGSMAYERFSGKLGSDKAASEYLNSLGIRGIKYLDNPSRGAGEGTYNYVMFNPAEEAIITHENGQRIPGAVEEAYRKLRDPKSKALFEERYPELKAQPWSTPQQEVSSASTSISYPNVEAKSPIIFKAFKNGKIDVGPINADIGGGRYDQITDWLSKRGVENVVYDPFNRPMAHNQAAMKRLAGGKADTATVSNVLNVIPDAQSRAVTIATAHDAVRPGGKVYFSMYAAPKAGVVKGRDAYQVGKKPSEYIPEIEAIFGKGNVYQQGALVIAIKGE